MKTLTQVAFVAAVIILLSNAGYAVGQTSAATLMHSSTPLVLADEEPAVDAAVTPGAGSWTSAEPISYKSNRDQNKGVATTSAIPSSRTAHDAELETTVSNPGISVMATRQAMPSGQSVNAAYAPSEKHAASAAPSYEELNKRIESLSKELSRLREDLGRLKAQEAGTK